MATLKENIIKLKNTVRSDVFGKAPLPATALIEINYDCVLRCKMCQLWTADFKKSRIGERQILNLVELQKVIDQFVDAGIKNIVLLGGEPFLRKEIFELIEYCRAKQITCGTVSNGYLVNEELAEKIVCSGLSTLSISIDGSKSEIHDRIRGVDGAFDHAVRAIELIKQKQQEHNTELPDVSIACTVSSNNFLDLPAMIDLAKEIGVRQIRFQYLSVIGQDTVDRTNERMGEEAVRAHNFVDIPTSYLLQPVHIEKLEEILTSIKEKGGEKIFAHIDLVFHEEDKSCLLEGIFPVWDCKVPWTLVFMKPTGDFMPCPMLPEYNMGNIKEKSFAEIWNCKRAATMRKRLAKGLLPICRKCCVIHTGEPDRFRKTYRKFFGMS